MPLVNIERRVNSLPIIGPLDGHCTEQITIEKGVLGKCRVSHRLFGGLFSGSAALVRLRVFYRSIAHPDVSTFDSIVGEVDPKLRRRLRRHAATGFAVSVQLFQSDIKSQIVQVRGHEGYEHLNHVDIVIRNQPAQLLLWQINVYHPWQGRIVSLELTQKREELVDIPCRKVAYSLSHPIWSRVALYCTLSSQLKLSRICKTARQALLKMIPNDLTQKTSISDLETAYLMRNWLNLEHPVPQTYIYLYKLGCLSLEPTRYSKYLINRLRLSLELRPVVLTPQKVVVKYGSFSHREMRLSDMPLTLDKPYASFDHIFVSPHVKLSMVVRMRTDYDSTS